MLELRRLQILCEVARQGSLTAAAAKLNYSTSAVSQQIARLEREVGLTLVERKSTGVALTRAGEILLAHADMMLSRAADAESDLRQLAVGAWGRLRVSAFASAAAVLVVPAIVAYREVEPRVAIELVELEDSAARLDALRQGELDLAIAVQTEDAADEPDPILDFAHLIDDCVDVLLPTSHRLASASSVTLEELSEEAWADCSGDHVRAAMQALGVEANVVFNGGHHQVTYSLVAAEVALSLCPRLTQPVLLPNVVVKPIAGEPIVRQVMIATRASEQSSPALALFVEVLCALAAARQDLRRRDADLDLVAASRAPER